SGTYRGSSQHLATRNRHIVSYHRLIERKHIPRAGAVNAAGWSFRDEAAPVEFDLLHVVGEQRFPVLLEIALEQSAGNPENEFGDVDRHGVDAAARGPEAQRRADAEDVDVGEPRCGAG